MDCPNCKTWNPEDKEVCWRCQTPLPKPKPPKKRSATGGFANWMWLLIVAFFAMSLLAQCFFSPLSIPQ